MALGAALLAACTNDYEDYTFEATGGGGNTGGAAGAGNAAGAGGAAGAATGGASGAGGVAGTGATAGTGGAPGDCGVCPTGFVCDNARCRCTDASQCGSGDGVSCDTGEGRCRCSGDTCRPGETCVVNGGDPACSCNGGQDCNNNEICCSTGCVSPWSDESNCGACGKACSAGEQCQGGHCVN